MTTQKMATAVQSAIDMVGAISGIRYAPDYPPEQIGDYFPAVTGFITEFDANTISSGFNQVLFNIMIQLHVAREGDLPSEVEKAMPYGDSVLAVLLADVTLNDTVSHVAKITGSFGVLNYGETKTLGFTFVLEGVKIH